MLVATDDTWGYVLTAYHVIDERVDGPTCKFGSWSAQGKVVGEDRKHDIAVVQLVKPPVKPMGLAATMPGRGTQIWIAGYPHARSYRQTAGQIRGLMTSREGGAWIRTSALATEGVSGGPIFNSRREVVALLVARDNSRSQWSPGCGPMLAQLQQLLAHCQRGQRPNPGLSAPLKPLSPLTPLLNPVPKAPDCRDELAALIKAQAASQRQIDQLMVLVNSLAKQKAIPGPPGKDGKDGKPGLPGAAAVIDYERLAVEVQSRLPPITVQVLKDEEVLDTEDVFLGGVLPLRLVRRERVDDERAKAIESRLAAIEKLLKRGNND